MIFRLLKLLAGRKNQRSDSVRQKRRMLFEGLENRAMMTVWEPVAEWTITDGYTRGISSLVPGQMVKIDAVFTDDDVSTFQQAVVRYGDSSLLLNSNQNAKSITYTTTSSEIHFSAGFGSSGGLSEGDSIQLKISKEKLSNLATIAPQLLPGGDVKYGYHIEGDPKAPIRYRGYVQVELYYAKGPNQSDILNLGKPIAASTLKATPGAISDFTLPAVPQSRFVEYPPPAGATHLLVIIDRDNKAAEYNESAADNIKAIRLSNIVALAPRLKADGSAEIGYRVDNLPFVNGPSGREVTVQAWYSTTPDVKGKIGTAPIFTKQMNPSQFSSLYVPVPAEKLANPPVGAKYLLTIVDNANLVRESNESDNVQALALPDLEVTSLVWDDKGGATIKVKVTNSANLPAGADLGLSLYWATGDNWAYLVEVAGRPAATLSLKSQARTDGEKTIQLSAKDLQTPTPPQQINIGKTVTHLLAAVDVKGTIVETSETNNNVSLKLPLVSLELSDAPAANTPEERVKLWLQKYEMTILKEGRKWNIDPRGVAGAIAWEALHNIQTLEDWIPFFGLRNRTYGPGKIHYKEGVFGTILEPFPLVVRELEALGVLPARNGNNDEERGNYVRTPAGAIEYIAAYLGTFANVYEQYGWANVRRDPAILGTLFQGSSNSNLAALSNDLPQRAAWIPNVQHPRAAEGDPTKVMAAWITKNNKFLRSALPKYAADLNKPADDRNWWPRLGTVSYVPKQIDAPTPFNNPVTELSWSLADLGAGATRIKGFYARSVNGGEPEGVLSIRGDRLVYTLPQTTLPTGTIYYSVEVGNRTVLGGRITMRVDVPQPTLLGATSENPTRVRVAWELRGSADTFNVERRSGTQDWQRVATVGGINREWLGTDHAADTDYEYRISAVSRTGLVSPVSNSARVRTQRGTTDAPTNLRLVSASSRNVAIRWDEVHNEEHYEVEFSTDGGGSWRLQENVPADHAYGANLTVQPGRDYLFRVVAVNSYGRSTPSNQIAITTPDDPLLAPGNLQLSNVGESSVRLNWADNSQNESGFEVWVARSGGAFQLSERVPANGTTALVEFAAQGGARLAPDTDYVVKLRAYRDNGAVSDFSPERSFRTLDNRPAAPGNLQLSNVGESSVRLNWADSSSNESGFEVWVARSGGAFQLSERVPANGTTALVEFTKQGGERLAPNTDYVVKLRAYRDNGAVSDYSPERSFRTLDNRPAAPGNLQLSNVGENSVRLSWNDNSTNESGFEVWVARTGGAFQLSERVPANGTTAIVEFESQGGSRLVPNTDYVVKLRAYRDNGVVSDFSPEKTFRTLDNRPAAPGGLTLSNVGESSVRLNWADSSSNESGFEVWVARPGGAFQLSERIPANGTTALVEFATQGGARLAPNTDYVVKLRAYRDNGAVSDFSPEKTFRTLDNRPAAPSNLQMSNVGENSIRLSWNDNSTNESGFEVWVARPGGAFQLSERVPANGTTALVEFESQGGSRLAPKTDYAVKLRAYLDNGAVSDYSPEQTFRTLDNRPAAPASLQLSNVGESSVRLNWADSSNNESGFEVWVARPGGAFQLSERVPANGTTALVEFESQGGSRLAPNTDYVVKLRAYRDNGAVSDYSPERTFRTLDNRPAAPTNLSVSEVQSQSFRLRWRDNSNNEVRFEVQVQREGTSTWYLSENVPTNGVTAVIEFEQAGGARLRRNTLYFVRIRAVTADGLRSEWSEASSIRTRS